MEGNALFFQKNLEYIKARYPHLMKEIENDNPVSGIAVEVCRAKNGMPVARLTKENRSMYANSIYDPELEAKRWAAKYINEESHSNIALCGCGFFYHLKEILNCGKFKKIICYEPCIDILKTCMHEIDLASMIDNQEVLLVAGNNPENMTAFGRYLQYMIMDIKFETLPVYQELFGEVIEKFQKDIWDEIRVVRVNMATLNRWVEPWLINAMNNLKYVIKSPGVRHFFNKFNGVPAIVVSAGPSLEKNIHLLQTIREKAVIICAGSSIRAMLKNNIKPHFLLAFDGSEINNKVYNDLDLKDVYLAYNFRMYHEVVERYAGKKIHLKLDTEQFSDMISFKSGGYEYGMIRGGFSCSHSSFDFAFRLGCNPIVLIGQDLCYNYNKRYADGQEESAQQFLDRNNLPPNSFMAKNIYGEDVVTDVEFQSFRIFFEKIIREHYHDKVEIINATEGGLPIAGSTDRKLADVIEQYCRREWGISKKIDQFYQQGRKELVRYGDKVLRIPREINILSEKAIAKVDEIIAKTESLRKYNFLEEFNLEKREAVFREFKKEYDEALNYREYEILLRDLRSSRITAYQIGIADLGAITDSETYDRKLQYWLNILSDTKKIFELIKEHNREIEKTGGEKNGAKLSGTGK